MAQIALTDDERKLLDRAVSSLAKRTNTVIEVDYESENEWDRKCIALALQGVCMYEGPGVWPEVVALANKLGIQSELHAGLQSWITSQVARD